MINFTPLRLMAYGTGLLILRDNSHCGFDSHSGDFKIALRGI